MINSLTGSISEKDTNRLYLLNSGIEWDIIMPSISISILPEIGETTKILTYLHHKEDSMKLYGFNDMDERNLFFSLIKISGIGPSQAIKIMSGMTPLEFIKSIEKGDIEQLSSIPGLGKKTVQKIILALSGKLKLEENIESNNFNDIIDGLVNMGYDKKASQSAVQKSYKELAGKKLGKEDLEKEIFRKALISLSV